MADFNSDPPSAADFLAGGGTMGALMRTKDWSKTSLGSPTTWPQSLRTVVRIMLSSRYAMWMAWGPDLLFFCNDAYLPTLGVKQPWALGAPSREVWKEVWDAAGPRINTVLTTGEATWDEGLLLFLERSGYPEETYHTFSYSPIYDDSGRVSGMLCVVTEETDRVIGERRLAGLRDLGIHLANASRQAEVRDAILRSMTYSGRDVPFSLTYLFDDHRPAARLFCAAGLPSGHDAAPEFIDASQNNDTWPAQAILDSGVEQIVPDLGRRFGDLPTGPWPLSPNEAVAVPLTRQGQERPAGFFVAALNPYRRRDAAYISFLSLLAGQIGAAIGNARAYEEERQRAEALTELDRAKTTFFSNVSHEFRTPLTLMLGPLEDVLTQARVHDQDRAQIDVAHRNGLRLLKLVNSLLDFSRIEAGRTEARYRPTDLASYTTELASNFHSAMDKAGLDFVIDAPPLRDPVHVDHDMWEKIVLNLLSNAFKFTFDGSVAVALRSSDDGRSAILTVSDTGTGIPAEELPRLFERFHRIEGAKGRNYEGSGIGLALVQELVKMHGGTITATSEPNIGTTFTVTVPFGTGHLPPGKIDRSDKLASTSMRAQAYVEEALRWLPEQPDLNDDGITPSILTAAQDLALPSDRDGEGRRVLLVDDNADMRGYVTRLLVGQGYVVEQASDGHEALRVAQSHPPDLILSDIMMPGLDGFGLLRAVRADANLRGTPTILLSARAGEEAQSEGRDAGADDYLTKPFSARELVSRIRTNLHLADLRRETARALQEEARILETLNQVSATVSAELDLDRAVQVVTDAATELTGAAFGAFFYNVLNERGESYMLYTLSGVPREAFARFPMPRNTAVFAPTFSGEGVVRSDDILADPRYGKNEPHHGMPQGHLPVRSYLAVPVASRSGEILGGLFFGHPETGRFDERAERLAVGIAAQASIAIDNARLYKSSQILNETLEAKVQERTAELYQANDQLRREAEERERAEEALRQAQKMETVGQLTGGVAHDFNNLLTIIIGNLETLKRQLARENGDTARMNRATDNALRGAQRAASLTQRLLAFSRRQPLEPKVTDVNRLVANMSDLLRRTLGEQVAIETVLAGGLWRVHVDPNQLESAILNLAINARDAMADGGRLTIETANTHLDEFYAARQAEVTPGHYALIAVTDTGSGMDRETLEKAFEPFFTTKDIGHGTGLGLSQVYGFVKQSGGHIKLYSEVGQGTTVKIYLPRLLADDEIGEIQESASVLPRAERHEVILVVEDDNDVRAHSVETLRELGYQVYEAANGHAALLALRENPQIQLLFTDVGLPGGLNGRQLADQARRERSDLKVLFTTGYARNAIVHDGRLDPGVHLVTKPFTYAALAAKLREIIDTSMGPPRILLVDDEEFIRVVMREGLEELGYCVEEAGSATEAMSQYRLLSGRIDGVVVDVGLPDRKGDALAAELRAANSRLALIVMSGYVETEVAARFDKDELIRFLVKPCTVEQLDETLRALGMRPHEPKS